MLAFVNAHLAAADDMCDRRNADFHDLSRRLQFDSGVPAALGATPAAAATDFTVVPA